MSLVEVLVAATVAMLLLAIAAVAVSTAGRMWANSRQRADCQQNALIVLERMREEFRWSDADSIVVQSQVLPITLPSGNPGHADNLLFWSCKNYNGTENFDSDGVLQYQRRDAFFLQTSTNEVWLANSFTTQTSPDLTPATLALWNLPAWTPQASPDSLQPLASDIISMFVERLAHGLFRVTLTTQTGMLHYQLSYAMAPLQLPGSPP